MAASSSWVPKFLNVHLPLLTREAGIYAVQGKLLRIKKWGMGTQRDFAHGGRMGVFSSLPPRLWSSSGSRGIDCDLGVVPPRGGGVHGTAVVDALWEM